MICRNQPMLCILKLARVLISTVFRLMKRFALHVVISQVPFGSGNLVNLELAGEAMKRGKTVLLAAGIGERDYTDGKAAFQLSVSMSAAGACSWHTAQELMAQLQQQSHSLHQ